MQIFLRDDVNIDLYLSNQKLSKRKVLIDKRDQSSTGSITLYVA